MDVKINWLPTWQHILLGESFGGQVSFVTSGELQLEACIVYLLFIPSCPPHQPLPQITLFWVEILE